MLIKNKFLRCLLLNVRGPKCFKDLRKVDGHVYGSYVEAAQKLGLLESDEMFVRAMEDANAEKFSLKKLQHYFARLIVHARPSDPQKLFDAFLDSLYPPFSAGDANAVRKSDEERKGEVLRNLEYFFRCMGTSCA